MEYIPYLLEILRNLMTSQICMCWFYSFCLRADVCQYSLLTDCFCFEKQLLKANFTDCFYNFYNCVCLGCFPSQNQPIIFSAFTLKLLFSSTFLKFPHFSMDSTPPSSKSMKTCGVKRGGCLES